MDRVDLVAVFGFASVVAAAVTGRYDLEPALLATLLAGFALSCAVWRIYDGRVWEALGWLAWVGGAVSLTVGLEGRPVVMTVFLGSLVLGLVLQCCGRFGLVPEPGLVDAG